LRVYNQLITMKKKKKKDLWQAQLIHNKNHKSQAIKINNKFKINFYMHKNLAVSDWKKIVNNFINKKQLRKIIDQESLNRWKKTKHNILDKKFNFQM